MGDEAKKLCTNCNQMIAASSFVTHEVHCHRHIQLCPKCKEPVRHTEMSQHNDEYHKIVSCEQCSTELEIGNLERHQAEECPKRPGKCAYCEMEMQMDALKEHQNYCGTRTESCPKCGNRIMLRDQVKHDDSNCAYPPPASRSPVDRSPRAARGNNNGVAGAPAIGAVRGRGARAAVAHAPNTRQHRHQSPPPAAGIRGTGRRDSERGTGSGGGGGEQPRNRSNNNSSRDDSEDVSYLLNYLDSPLAARGAGPSDRNRTTAANLYERPVLLPCEHCNQVFPLDQFAFHQAVCNFGFDDEVPYSALANDSDEEVAVVPTAATRRDLADGLVREHADLETSDDTLLPCEICGESFSMDDFILHQTVCQPQENIRPAVQPKVPNVAVSKPNVNVSREADHDAGEGVLMIPCEFCGEAFTDETLYMHQSNCDADMGRTSRLDNIRNVHNNYDTDYLARLDGARHTSTSNTRGRGSSRPLQPKVTNQSAAARQQQAHAAEAPRMVYQPGAATHVPPGTLNSVPKLRGHQQQQGPIVREASVTQPTRPTPNNNLHAAGSKQQMSMAAANVYKPINSTKNSDVLGRSQLMERYGLQEVLTINNDRNEVRDNRHNAATGSARNGELSGATRMSAVEKNQVRGNNLHPQDDTYGNGSGVKNNSKSSSSRNSVQVGSYHGQRAAEGASNNGKKLNVKSNAASGRSDYSVHETGAANGAWSAYAETLDDLEGAREDVYRGTAAAPLIIGRGRGNIGTVASSHQPSPQRPLPQASRPGASLSRPGTSGASKPATSSGQGYINSKPGR